MTPDYAQHVVDMLGPFMEVHVDDDTDYGYWSAFAEIDEDNGYSIEAWKDTAAVIAHLARENQEELLPYLYQADEASRESMADYINMAVTDNAFDVDPHEAAESYAESLVHAAVARARKGKRFHAVIYLISEALDEGCEVPLDHISKPRRTSADVWASYDTDSKLWHWGRSTPSARSPKMERQLVEAATVGQRCLMDRLADKDPHEIVDRYSHREGERAAANMNEWSEYMSIEDQWEWIRMHAGVGGIVELLQKALRDYAPFLDWLQASGWGNPGLKQLPNGSWYSTDEGY